MPVLTKIHDPAAGPMRVAAFMSGSGTNLEKILEHQERLSRERGRSPFEVVVIFTDNSGSRAVEIAAEHDLPAVVRDIGAFYAKRGRPKSDLSLRPEFDALTAEALKPWGARLAAFAGYMSVASPVLVRAFFGVNVHPADLSVEIEGKRRWVGGHAVRDAIKAGEKTIASSTHVIENTVDGGRILMISKPVPVGIPAGADLKDRTVLKEVEESNQGRLKEQGDWVIFPLSLEYLADGRFSTNGHGTIHFDGRPAPKGLRL
ncbi:MAG: formyl transferase [Deltaproteobacteria bacterium]|nr:formyl transferase [Deltaproteobacteria bacterium]